MSDVAIPIEDLPAVIDAEATYRTVPPYVVDMAIVLTDTEDDPDQAIRDVRKIAVQAITALAHMHAEAQLIRDYVPIEELIAKAPTDQAAVITPREIRVWCRDNGIDVNAKGKIPTAIVDRYLDANA